MKEREIARELARLREELADLGSAAPQAQRQVESLGRSIEHLQSDLALMRISAVADPSPTVEIETAALANTDAELPPMQPAPGTVEGESPTA